MILANLLPVARQIARRQSARKRLWTGSICIGSILLAGVLMTVEITWRDDRRQIREKLEDSERSTQVLKHRVASLNRELEHAWAGLYAAERIRDQPDWSILLAAVAERTGDQVVLSRIGLERPAPKRSSNRAPGGGAAVAQSRPQPRDLVLSGAGASAHEVSLFSVRLEELNLFSRVIIEQSSRDQTGLEGAIAFTIRCSLIEEVD